MYSTVPVLYVYLYITYNILFIYSYTGYSLQYSSTVPGSVVYSFSSTSTRRLD